MRSMTEGAFFDTASTKKQDPLRLTSFDTSPGGPGEAVRGLIQAVMRVLRGVL